MKINRIFSFLIALLASSTALAQSNPGLVTGQIPSAAQWNSYFSAKTDYFSGGLPISRGGTGATTLAGAQAALGISTGLSVTPSTTNASFYPLFISSVGGSGLTVYTSGGITINPVSNTIAATNFSGAFSGNLTGNASGTAGGLAAQYIDWNATSGGTSIANKPSGLPPTGTAGGVLSGTYPNPGFASSTGSGGVVLAADAIMTRPNIGVATATSVNGLVINSTNATLSVVSGKTLGISNSLSFGGTDGTTQTFPSTSAVIARTDAGQTFTGTQAFSSTISGSINGNAATATALAADPTDCSANTYANAIDANGNLTCASITNASTTATSSNTASTIVARDGSGNFSATTVSAALNGNATTATTAGSITGQGALATLGVGRSLVSSGGNLNVAVGSPGWVVMRYEGSVWVAYKPDGTILSTSGTTSDGLQEAINYAVTNYLSVDIGDGVVNSTTAINVPPNQTFGIHSGKGTTLQFASGISGSCLVMDSSIVSTINWEGQIVGASCNGGYVLQFKPHNLLPIDAIYGIADMDVNIRAVVSNGGTPLAVIGFTPDNGGIGKSRFYFTEVNAIANSTTDIAVNMSGAGSSSGFENNKIESQFVHGFTGTGIQVGASSTHADNIHHNIWEILGCNTTASASGAVCMDTYAYGDNIKISTRSDEGPIVHGLVFESTTYNNYAWLVTAGLSGDAMVYAGTNNETVVNGLHAINDAQVVRQAGINVNGNFPVMTATYGEFNDSGVSPSGLLVNPMTAALVIGSGATASGSTLNIGNDGSGGMYLNVPTGKVFNVGVAGATKFTVDGSGGAFTNNLTVTGNTTLNNQLTVSYSGGLAVIRDTAAYSAGVSGPALLMQGLDSTSTNVNLGYIKANPTASQSSIVSLGVGNGGSTSIAQTWTPLGASITGAVALPGLSSSSATTTGTVCWTTGTGNLTVDTTTTCLLSSGKYKQDDHPLLGGLDLVMALKPVAYKLRPEFNPTGLGEQIGFYAEDVAKVDSRLVSTEVDGSPHAVRYQQMTAVLAKAIQEQQSQIDAMKAKLEALTKASPLNDPRYLIPESGNYRLVQFPVGKCAGSDCLY